MFAIGLAGCRLPSGSGPVSQSLVTSREFSQQGVSAIEQGKWDEAEAWLAKAVRACPIDSEARRHYAETLWHRDARWEALAQMEEAGRLAREDAGLHVRIAEMRLAMGQVESARIRAEHALELDRKLAAAWAIRGRVMRAAGQARQGLADFYRALSYAPVDRQILLEIAEMHRQLDQPQRALLMLQNLCDTYSPGEEPQQVLYLLGLAYSAMGRHDDAVESFSAALMRDRPTPEILCRLGDSQRLLGRSAEAAAAAHEALALDPEHRPSRELLTRIELAQQPKVSAQR